MSLSSLDLKSEIAGAEAYHIINSIVSHSIISKYDPYLFPTNFWFSNN